MITFFTVVRPFTGEFDGIQRRAIASWKALGADAEIILFGLVEGAEQVAEELDASLYEPYRNEHGTPLLNNVFEIAEQRARHDLLWNINADIVISHDQQVRKLLHSLEGIRKPLVIGQRTEWDRATDTFTLHPPSGMDYFLYRRGTLGTMPPFAVGCTAYDNWLVWAGMEQWGMTVIDATAELEVWHINHSYPYEGGKPGMLAGGERNNNHRLAKATGCPRWYGVNDAPYVLNNGKVELRG